jgi:hypothetical protein
MPVVDESDYFARWTRRRRKLVRSSLGWGLSIAVHAALLGAFVGARRRAAEPLPVPTMLAGLGEGGGALSKLALRRDLLEKRVALVRRARAALAKNDLALGVFLLEANAIDAEEEGKTLDLERARGLYGDRVKDLRARLEAKDAPGIEEVVPAVLFVVLDVEVVLLYPWVVTARETGWSALMTMAPFLALLVVGLVYEWKKGAMEWER